jgi:hypothetical protein
MKPTPVNEKTLIYARPNGMSYHLNRKCIMLVSGQFENYKYTTITPKDISKRHLLPCVCAYGEAKLKEDK